MIAINRGFLIWTGSDHEPAGYLPGQRPFDPPGSFEHMFRVLERRVEARGDAAVPKVEVFEGERLGSWVQAIRLRYRKDQLSADRIQRLERLPGWVWRTR